MKLESYREPSQEGGKLINMNNFHLNFPGVFYRSYDDSVERVQVMNAIDELLAGDFKDLDISRISRDIEVANDAMVEALNSKRYKTSDELKQSIATQLKAGKKAREELRPLFDKLVAMGFSSEVLAR